MTSAEHYWSAQRAGLLTLILACSVMLGSSVFALPSYAEAATYVAKRPGVSVELRTRGDRLVWVDYRYKIRCNGEVRRRRGGGGRLSDKVEFDSRTGRFFQRDDLRGDAASFLHVQGGTRHPGLITGFFSYQSSRFVKGGPNIFCHSGRSWEWPRIRFVARMVSPGGR